MQLPLQSPHYLPDGPQLSGFSPLHSITPSLIDLLSTVNTPLAFYCTPGSTCAIAVNIP